MAKLDLKGVLRQQQADFSPVISFDHQAEKIMAFDFAESNTSLNPGIFNDTVLFSDWVNQQLLANEAKFGIGGYAELRNVYAMSTLFDAGNEWDEPRRLHLGTDIWGKPASRVMAPLDGIVHSFAFNKQRGDYGATIILTHNINGRFFYTLYGHLSLASIANLEEGQRIGKGDVFADFGIPAENGSWPPHLHFQIIEDMDHWTGDYPGVCRLSEKNSWLANSPDPDLVLQLNQFLK